MTITEEMRLPGPATRAEDVPALCEALADRYRRGADEVVCDLGALTRPALPDLDVLVRMALTARRCRGVLRLTGAPPALAALLELTGLGEVLREALGEPEQREPPVGVQERVEPDDPPF
ncbi:STAS domain-containing protein [Streptomyces sp. NPDC012888]|uniref:STAS domain-containing protein n=1 Tax=Streptomyces sp. NPDC012888 TaxID=3364855 RepID=UPI0036789D33